MRVESRVTSHESLQSKASHLLAGLAAALLAACAQVPQNDAETLAQTEAPTVAAAPAPQEAKAPSAEPAPAPAAAAEPPAPPTDVWERVRGGFQLANLENPLVRDWETWYSTRPDYVARMVERGSRFLYHVVEEVERRKMPAEIALLPMIESAYNPQAYSRAHASGMWQFIPSTGKLYGLRQNFWYDGRRDVLAATAAALDYLEKLYGMFGDWNHALAAYNWGEGAVARAIAKNQAKGLPTDYESLTMPAETRNYLPKLQAVKNIVASPEQFGITLAAVPNRPYFATVTTSHHIDVELAAKLAEIPLEEFRFLNPAHNKPVIKADGSESIVLPIDKIAVFQSNLESHDQPLVSWQAYTVKRSDKPEKIAAKHGITLAQLKQVNGINGRKKIVAGQTLMVPLNGSAEPNLPDLPAPKVAPVRYRAKKARCYQVRNGVRKAVRCAAAKKPVVKTRAPAKKKATSQVRG
ncbi:MAG: transglycosylase SLT domain-containing protein [Betaproteobacteria bacterium]|nr:transglycosylase SLT domain-containing protein [Betaproteobacteria bacterium]